MKLCGMKVDIFWIFINVFIYYFLILFIFRKYAIFHEQKFAFLCLFLCFSKLSENFVATHLSSFFIDEGAFLSKLVYFILKYFLLTRVNNYSEGRKSKSSILLFTYKIKKLAIYEYKLCIFEYSIFLGNI